MRITSTSYGGTITLEKHSMASACRNLAAAACETPPWNVALSKVIPSTSHDMAVASKKHAMTISCSKLDIGNSCIQSWHVTLSTSKETVYASSGIASTLDKHCMTIASRND